LKGRLVVALRPEPEERARALEGRIEIAPPDGPAAVGYPRARAEVDGVERRAATGPRHRRAGERADPPLGVALPPRADALAAVERLRLRLAIGAAPFQKTHADAGMRELRREREPRRATSDDADVRVEADAIVPPCQIALVHGAADRRSPALASRAMGQG